MQETVITLPFNTDLEEKWAGEMASILLACPACKKRISSSAHSCPHCGEPLSDEWEKRGLNGLKVRQLGCAVLLIPFLALVVVLGFNNEPDQGVGTRATKPKEVKKLTQAFAFKPDLIGGRGLFVDIRARNVAYDEKQIQVLCPADGTGEIVALLEGTYVAVNLASRGWARSTGLWAVEGNRLLPVFDSGVPNDVPKQFEVLERHLDAIIETGTQMCPLAEPAGERTWQALSSAVTNYQTNARRLGISIP